MQLRTFVIAALFVIVALNASAAPALTSLVMNSTYGGSGGNTTVQNLTAYAASNETSTFAYDWRVNGTSMAVLNLNFDVNDSAGPSKTRDFSSFGNNATIGTTVWNATGGYNGTGAYQFDGVITSYLSIAPDSNQYPSGLNGNFTIMAWIKTNFSASNERIISEQSSTGGGQGLYQMRVGYNGCPSNCALNIPGVLEFEYGNFSDTATHFWDVPGHTILSDNQWHHVVGMLNGTSITTFVDGNFENTTSILAWQFAPASPQPTLYIGVYGTGGELFNGVIDDVRIYNRSFTPQEIKALYQNMTNVILNSSIKAGENWSICVTPQSANGVGVTNCTTGLLVKATTCAPPAINNDWTIEAGEYCAMTNQNINIGTGALTITDPGILSLFTSNISASQVALRAGASVFLTATSILGKI